ncbi:DUF4132 domain-containing protein [Nonomuraea sp. NPDC002799]
MQLSPTGRYLHHHLTDPEAGYPKPWPDGAALTAVDLGNLLPLAYGTAGTGGPAFSMRVEVEDEVKRRQPVFTPESCVALYEALVAGLAKRKWANLCLAAAALVRCPGGAPVAELAGAAGTLTAFMVAKRRTEEPYALLAVAGLAGLDEVAAGALDVGPEPLGAAELDLVLSLDPADRALLAEVGPRAYGSPPELPGVWERLAAVPAYARFARSALESAAARLTAIHAREIPYQADKAFGAAETAAIGRAVRLALAGDEPWLPELLATVLAQVAVAPTAAKTLPSQALLYEIARAIERHPTPEAIEALRTARAVTRHAGVIKQLDRMIVRAEPGLADRAEVAFRMPDPGRLEAPLGAHKAVIAVADDAFELTWWQGSQRLKSLPAAVRKAHADEVKRVRGLADVLRRQVTTLAGALETALMDETCWPYETWRTRIAEHPIAATVARRLVWEVEIAPGTWQAALGDLDPSGDSNATGDPNPLGDLDAPAGRVRLWHPVRATPAEVAGLREAVAAGRVRQPFEQATREVYRPAGKAAGDVAGDVAGFAGRLVDYGRLYTMFGQRGWRAGMLGPWEGGETGEATRVPAGGGWRASFGHEYVQDGANGRAVTGQVGFQRLVDGGWAAVSPAEVPALVFSEAMRDVSLFVAATSIAPDPEPQSRVTSTAHSASPAEP